MLGGNHHHHGHGHGAIDAMLAATQAQFPNYRLSLVSGIEAHNNFVRFSWGAGGTAEAPLYIGGTDFATLAADGRIIAPLTEGEGNATNPSWSWWIGG